MEINRWWDSDPGELYWMEITGRNDLGVNLAAPQLDERGAEYAGYSLVREVRDGEIVFHFDRKVGQIVAWSRAVGASYAGTIEWAARGTSFREHGGGRPYRRPGWFINLEGPFYLSEPVTLAWLRQHENTVQAVRDDLHRAHSGTLYFPFAISDFRPLRAAQTYMVKFPAALVRQIPTLAATTRDAVAKRPSTRSGQRPAHPAQDAAVGTNYREADEHATTAGRDPFDVDPTLVDRALRGHAMTQNALARLLEQQGLQPRSPRPDEPQFDLSWVDGQTLYVAEVKSLTDRNEEQQLRLGLGQVLRYRNLLADGRRRVQAVLAIEHEPSDARWVALCDELAVRLTWPPAFRGTL